MHEASKGEDLTNNNTWQDSCEIVTMEDELNENDAGLFVVAFPLQDN